MAERTVRPTGVGNARTTWQERTSLLLLLEDSTGVVGLGEAAPLPGFSSESLETARADLERLVRGLTDTDPASLCASARFALDTALLDLAGQRSGRPAWSLLRDDAAPETIETNGLVTSAPATWAHEVAARLTEGVRCVKLKVGHAANTLHEEIAAVRALLPLLPPGATLRLDANCTLSSDDTVRLRTELDDARIEYVEDPVPRARLEALRGGGLAWAADELLRAAPEKVLDIGASTGLAALILKPTLIGALARTLELASHASARSIDAVFTHSFEGPVAHAATVQLAFATSTTTPRAMGLADHDVLRRWPGFVPTPRRIARPTAPGLGLDPGLRQAVYDA